MEVKVGKIYRHFKGDLVKVICIAKHSEDLSELVIYEHVETKEIWARPREMFEGLVDHEKYPEVGQVYRFEEVND